MCKHATLRNNLLAMCFIWSVSGFCFYLIDFYVKYFPGSVFFNKGFFGICDALSLNYVQLLALRVRSVPSILRICLIGAAILSIIYTLLPSSYVALIPLIVGLTRMQINAILAYAYHVN